MPDPQVEVRLMERRDATRYMMVRLRSAISPRLIVEVEVPDSGSDQRNRIAVGAAGGALAEYLGDRYGDHVDPSDCAHCAAEAYNEMMADFNQHVH